MRFVGEVWNDNPALLSFWVGDYKKYNGFASNLPMAMDFPLQRSIVTGLTNDFEMWGGTTKAIYNVIAQDFLYRNPYRELVTFVDNHDIDRMYDMLGATLYLRSLDWDEMQSGDSFPFNVAIGRDVVNISFRYTGQQIVERGNVKYRTRHFYIDIYDEAFTQSKEAAEAYRAFKEGRKPDFRTQAQ